MLEGPAADLNGSLVDGHARVQLWCPHAEGVEAPEQAVRAGRRALGHAELHREREALAGCDRVRRGAVELVDLDLPPGDQLLDVRGAARKAGGLLRAVLQDDAVVEDPAAL